MSKYLFISIREEYTNRIFEGTKKIELRKSKPNVIPGDKVIIYCTSPVKAIVGIAHVKGIIIHKPNTMWKLHSKVLGIDRQSYLDYYGDSEKAIGIVLSKPKKLVNNISLNLIKERVPSFTPPQTYKYFLNFTSPIRNNDFRLTPF